MVKNKRILIIAIYIGVALYILPMYPHGGSANELTRWATAASLVEKGWFEISWTEPLIGPNVDTAKIGDRTYSNKAPGTAIVAAPVYALMRVFVGPPDASNIRITWFAMKLVVSTLPLLLLGIWLFRRKVDEFGLAAVLFATPLFLYSLLFFSHVFAAVLVYAAFRLLFDDGELTPKRLLLAGVASGLAVISEFPAVFAVAIFGIGLLFTGKVGLPKRVGLYLAGGLPFAIFLLLYNNSLFGSPLSFSYAHESLPEWAEVASHGVFGIGVPTFSNIFLLLVSPSRGLFFFTPLFLLSVYSFIVSPKKTLRYRVRLAAIVISVLIICGHGAAHGGWAFGARYLIFVMPLLLDPILNGETDRMPCVLRGGLFGISFVLSVVGIMTFPFPPPEFAFPHNDFFAALMFGEGWFVPTFANIIGISSPLVSALPLLAALLAVGVLVSLAAIRRSRFVIGIAAATVIAVGYMLIPGLDDTAQARIRRASIAERYFRPAGRLTRESEAALNRRDFTNLRLINDLAWTTANTRAYAPDDFPYLADRELSPAPQALFTDAQTAQQKGNAAAAAKLLEDGKTRFPALACEFGTGLAVVYYTSGDKDRAVAELEAAERLTTPASRVDCAKSGFLLGSLYSETGRAADADAVFKRFLANTANEIDPTIKGMRSQLKPK